MKQCPLCRGEAKFRFALGHTAAWECVSRFCSLLFADPQLDNRSLAEAYKAHYYPSNGNGKKPSYDNTPEEILRQTFKRVEGELGPLEGKSLLDFGCGVGGLCNMAKEYRARVAGIEPDASARERTRKSSGLISYESLASLKEADREAKFDIVTMWDVIEHLREPWKGLQELSTVLQKDGWLLLSTPNAACLRARIERARWENMVNPTHFYYFTRKSLEAVLRRAGFSEIFELRFPIQYPGHARPRWLLHRALVSCRLQGQLIYVARHNRLEKANCLRRAQEPSGTGAHEAV